MKIAYLIAAHNNPRLLKRAVSMLSTAGSSFFIHIDNKSDLTPFSGITGSNIFILKDRIPVHWGEFSQVEATLLLLNEAMQSSMKFDYFVLLSGGDYPLRSGDYVRNYLGSRSGTEFINVTAIPAPGFPISKLTQLRPPSNQPIRRLACRALGKLGMAHRNYSHSLQNLTPYAGSSWWALSRNAVSYILTFTRTQTAFVDYFRYAFTSDEMFFHTILGNSSFSKSIKRNLTFVDWPPNTNHPRLLNANHVALFNSQDAVRMCDEWGAGEALFARKFSDSHLDVIDLIDSMIARKESRATSLQQENSH